MNLITYLIVIVAVLTVGFSGCVDKQPTEATKSTGAAQNSVKLPSQYILLNRSAELTDYIGEYTKAAAGKTFLVIEMTLENYGYKTFSINPNYFTVVIDSVAYPYDSATFSTDMPLTSMALLDGGKASGTIVFQIPKDKTQYTIVYVGQGDYNFIYGDLVVRDETQEKQEPTAPVRTVTVDFGNGLRMISSEGSESFGEIADHSRNLIGHKDYFTTNVVVSGKGSIIQETSGSSNEGASIDIVMTTILGENLNQKRLEDAIKQRIADLSEGKFNIKEKGTYDVVLQNKDEVTVHQVNVEDTNGQRPPKNRVDVFGYMLDNNTTAIVAFTYPTPETKSLILKTLEIGEPQDVQ